MLCLMLLFLLGDEPPPFMENPWYYASNDGAEYEAIAALSDLRLIRLSACVFLTMGPDTTVATHMVLAFDWIKTDHSKEDFWIVFDLPDSVSVDPVAPDGAVYNFNVMTKDGPIYRFLRFFPHEPTPYQRFIGGRSDPEAFRKWLGK